MDTPMRHPVDKNIVIKKLDGFVNIHELIQNFIPGNEMPSRFGKKGKLT